MPVTVHVPAALRALTGGESRVRIDEPVGTVADALEGLWRILPAARDRVLTEQGEVRPHVNVFVEDESIRFSGGLATLVRDGAEIWILPAVSGG